MILCRYMYAVLGGFPVSTGKMSVEEPVQVENIIEDFLLCAVCRNLYESARILPCLHSTCGGCLHVSDTQSVVCHVCERAHTLPGEVGQLPENHLVNGLVELYKEHRNVSCCSVCQKGECAFGCLGCKNELCDVCAAEHSQDVPTHVVVGTAEYRQHRSSDQPIVPTMICSEHRSHEITSHCNTCRLPICVDCLKADHSSPGHDVKPLKEAAGECLALIVEKLKEKDRKAEHGDSTKETTAHEDEEKHDIEMTSLGSKEVPMDVSATSHYAYSETASDIIKQILHISQLRLSSSQPGKLSQFFEMQILHGKAAECLISSNALNPASWVLELLILQTFTELAELKDPEFQPLVDICRHIEFGACPGIASSSRSEVTDYPSSLKLGEEGLITVSLQDWWKNRVTKIMGDVQGHVTKPDGSSSVIREIKHTELKGLFQLKIRAQAVGETEVSVSVQKMDIKDSPISLDVYPRDIRESSLVSTIGEGTLSNPWGFAVAKSGNVIVADRNNDRVQIYDSLGKHKKAVEFTKFPEAFVPNCIAVADNGNCFVTETGNKQVVVCDENGGFIQSFGKDELKHPVGIAISPTNGRVYVVDMSAGCIRIYTQQGKYISSFGTKGTGEGQFSSPFCIAINSKGNIIVSDRDNHRIQVWNADGQFLFSFGEHGSADGQLSRPVGVCTDQESFIYVSDYGNDRVVKFSADGKFEQRIDRIEHELCGVTGISVVEDRELLQIYAADWAHGCIKVFSH
ncbi:tripartite motif-containing protein 3-like [Ptychodera flava]|uniref:tripartite motif-containing protein 3-like n=1 Tax=Ptychodera flava TaxID=63121 RepID=UPI00396A1CE2